MHSPGGSAVFGLVARLAGAVLAIADLLFLVARAGLPLGERPSCAVGSTLRLRVWRVVLAGCGGSSATLDGLAMMSQQVCDIDLEGYEDVNGWQPSRPSRRGRCGVVVLARQQA